MPFTSFFWERNRYEPVVVHFFEEVMVPVWNEDVKFLEETLHIVWA
jgi:hypothetical protein